MIKGKSVVAFTSNDASEYAFRSLVREGVIDVVVTIDEKKAERAGVSNYLDVRKYIDSSRIYYARRYSLKHEEDIRFFREGGFDIGLILGWNRLIPPAVIDLFSLGIIGFHGTPLGLPRGRGRSPTIWSIALGYDVFYFHAFRLTPGVDDGPIYVTRKVNIEVWDTVHTLHSKLAYILRDMAVEAMDMLIEGKKGTPQEGTPIYFRKRSEKDGHIKWFMGGVAVYNLVRAITRPYPGAWTWHGKEKIRVWWGVPVKEVEGKPGEVLAVMKNSFLVGCGKDSFLVVDWDGPTPVEGDILM